MGFNHYTTAFFGYLGTDYISNGTTNGIHNIMGVENTFTSGDNFAFQYDEDPDYMVDVLSETEGVLYFTCQDEIGRSVYYDEGSYRVICTSSIFGPMADSDGTNTKADLMARYFSFLSNDSYPHIWASTDELNFGTQYLNYPATMTFNIRNLGYVNLDISSVEISGEGFTYTGLTAFDLGWGEQTELEITFTSENIGTFNATLSIQSNDPDLNPLLIDLYGECVFPPEIDVIPEELIATVPPGEIDYDILTIFNNGVSDLTYQISATETTSRICSTNPYQPTERGSNVTNVLDKDNSNTYPTYLGLLTSLRDSVLIFADDMESGVNGWTTEMYGGAPDDLWHQTELNCNSPTYSWWCGIAGSINYATGNRINTAVISPVIDMTTIDTTVTLLFFENYNTESNYDFCMVDVTTNGGTSWIHLRGDAGNAPSGSSGGWIQTILDLTPFTGNEIQIRFYFDTIDSINNSGSGWFFDDVLVYFEGVPWLPIDPNSGTITAGQSAEINITYDASNLAEGDYTANITILSNDPAEPEVIIPVTLTVGYVSSEPDVLPVVTKLHGNYPNPFNPETTISFTAAVNTENLEIFIYNIRGQKVKQLLSSSAGQLSAGQHSVIWNGTDKNNRPVSSGIYFYQLNIKGKAKAVKKCLLLK